MEETKKKSITKLIEENPSGKYMLLIGWFDFKVMKNDYFSLDIDPRDFKEINGDMDKAYDVFNYLVDRETMLMDKYSKHYNRYNYIKLYYGKSWIEKWENTNERYKNYKRYYTGSEI